MRLVVREGRDGMWNRLDDDRSGEWLARGDRTAQGCDPRARAARRVQAPAVPFGVLDASVTGVDPALALLGASPAAGGRQAAMTDLGLTMPPPARARANEIIR